MVRRTRDPLECATTKLSGKKNDVVDFDDNDVFVGPVSVVGAFKSRLHEYSVSFPVTAHDTCSIQCKRRWADSLSEPLPSLTSHYGPSPEGD